MIAPVIPPRTPLQELVSGPQVTNRLVRPRNADLVYGICTVGDGGRISDKIAFTALGWRPGTRLELTCEDAGVLLARTVPDGDVVFAGGGYFRVPYRLRRRVGLLIGHRALLIGHRTRHALLIYPPAALDELCAAEVRLLTASPR